MKSITTFLAVVFVLAVMASVFYGGYLAIVYIWQLFSGIDATLRLILLSSFAVFLLGCFIIAGALKSASQTKLKAQLTEAKIGLYKTLLGLHDARLSALQSGGGTSQADILLKLEDINAEINMVAGGSVIASHRKLEQAISRQESGESISVLHQQLVKKMRQDLGHAPNLDESRLRFLVINQKISESANRERGASA